MGHSDMKVSLTYLRGLEVKQLDVDESFIILDKPNNSIKSFIFRIPKS